MEPAPFKIIGHRGACGYAPENTLASFEKAIALGVRWVEFDVQFSSDGVPMVIHDKTLDRTTRLKGPVCKVSSQHLMERVECGGGGIPTLQQVLTLLDTHQVGAYVEIKSCPRGALLDLLALAQPSRQDRIVSSFHHRWLLQARRLMPSARIQALFSRPPLRKPAWLDSLVPEEVGVGFHQLTTPSLHRLQRWGYPVVAYTVNHQEDLDRAMRMGLAGVFSDFPDRSPTMR